MGGPVVAIDTLHGVLREARDACSGFVPCGEIGLGFSRPGVAPLDPRDRLPFRVRGRVADLVAAREVRVVDALHLAAADEHHEHGVRSGVLLVGGIVGDDDEAAFATNFSAQWQRSQVSLGRNERPDSRADGTGLG